MLTLPGTSQPPLYQPSPPMSSIRQDDAPTQVWPTLPPTTSQRCLQQLLEKPL